MSTSPLLLLPPEIRLLILAHLLTHTTPILTSSAHTLSPPTPTLLHLSPSILRTCRALYTEGFPLLYRHNTFQAHPQLLTASVFALDPLRRITSRRCIAHIRRWHVRVRLDCDTYYPAEAVKEVFSGMEVVEVEVFRASWGVGGYEALEGWRGVRGVGRARVHGSLGGGLATWLERCMESVGEGVVGGWVEDEGFVGRRMDW